MKLSQRSISNLYIQVIQVNNLVWMAISAFGILYWKLFRHGVGVNSPMQLAVVCSYVNLWTQVWGYCTLEPGLTTSADTMFANDRVKAVIHLAHDFVMFFLKSVFLKLIVLHKPYYAVFPYLHFGFVGRLAFLNVAIIDMHISLALCYFRFCRYIWLDLKVQKVSNNMDEKFWNVMHRNMTTIFFVVELRWTRLN